MDQDTFDALTRTAVADGGTRRTLLRLLAGSALSAVVARLGLAEQAAAKAKQHKGKAKRKHHPGPSQSDQADHAAAKSPRHPTSSGVQGERKRKGKGKGKHRPKPPPPLPAGCENCGECQMCQNGVCVPDPALGGVPCLGSGPACSHCLLGVCTANEQLPCDDGICVRRGQCCSGEKYCADPESPTGFSCIDPNGCCPGQKKCGNGACVSLRGCCPETPVPPCSACGEVVCSDGQYVCNQKCCANEKPCADGTCVSKTSCCHGEKPCGNGVCVDSLSCCPNQTTCEAGICVDKGMCCPFYKKCPDGLCVKETECCAGQQRCGGMCCLASEECCNDYCEVTADGPWIPCGDGACITTQVYQCCGEKVCWADSDCCGDRCCPAPHKCCGTTCCFGSA